MTTLAAFVFMLLLSAVPAVAQAPDTRIIASTKDWSITAQQFQQILDSLPDQAKQFYSLAKNRREFLNQLVRTWVIATEAREKGTDKTGKFKALTDFYGNTLISREYRRQITEDSKVTDEAIAAFYKNNPDDFMQVKLSHILILNGDSPMVRQANVEGAGPRDQARKKIEEVKAKMRDGAGFEALAKEYSQDPGSAQNGGDLGFISKGQLVPEVEKPAFAMKADTYSDIIESPFGFHILHVTELKVSPIDEVREQIRHQLGIGQVDTEIDSKVKAAGVKIDEAFFQP